MAKKQSGSTGEVGLLAELSLVSVALIWGINIPVMKIALSQRINPFAFNAIRLVFSAVVLVFFAIRSAPKEEFQRLILRWKPAVAYAMLVSVLYQLLFLLAVSGTTSVNTALIMATVPLWTATGARVFLGERLHRAAWGGMYLAFAGTALVAVANESHAEPGTAETQAVDSVQSPPSAREERVSTWVFSGQFYGNLCALAAAVAWAAGTILGRPLLRSIRPMSLSAFSAVFGLPIHLVIAGSLLSEGLRMSMQLQTAGCILYSGLLSTGLALPMWNYGVQHAGPAHAAMFQNLAPLTAIVVGWMVLSESVSTAHLLGGTLIIGGLSIMRRYR